MVFLSKIKKYVCQSFCDFPTVRIKVVCCFFTSGFRYTSRPLYRSEHYLPSTCPLTLQNQTLANAVETRFCDFLVDFVDRNEIDCTITNVFIQCPAIGVASVVPPDHPNLNP